VRPTAPLLIAVLAIVGAVIGYTMWGQHQKLQQERAVTALVADTTTQLRQALTATPTREMFSRIDGNLRSCGAGSTPRASRSRPPRAAGRSPPT